MINRTRSKYLKPIVSIILLFCTAPVLASTEHKATITFENTNFIFNRNDYPINDQETLEADFRFVYDNDSYFRAIIHPRLKFYFLDFSRNRYLPNETYVTFYRDNAEASAGLQVIHWGAGTSFNPTDVINRRDFEDNFFDPEKLGEVIVSGQVVKDQWGPFSEFTIQALALPFFQQAPLPELDTRYPLRGVASGIPFTVSDTQDTPDYPEAIGGALSVSATVSPIDISLHYYHGPTRDPGYYLDIDSNGALRLKPFYYLIDMIGANVEAAVGNFNLHLETAFKITALNDPQTHDILFEDNNAIPESYFQYVPGFDYTFHEFAGNGDMTFTFEYLGELTPSANLRNFRPFQNDLFFGFRYEFLNQWDSILQFGVIKDLGNREAAILVNASTRIYKNLRFGVGGIFVNRDDNLDYSPLSFFDNNSQIKAWLSYSFGGKRNREPGATAKPEL